jgi:hypothetical protein
LVGVVEVENKNDRLDKEKNSLLAHCNSCCRKTKHQIVATEKITDDDEIEGIGSITLIDTYQMLKCKGCETVKLRHLNWFSVFPEEENIYCYPPDVSRRLPRWESEIPTNIRDMLRETYNALHGDGRRLALMGARTVLDMVMLDKIGDIGNFFQKLEALEAAGFIGRRQREYLDAALNAGHAAAHRGHNPKATQVNQVMDIIENLLEGIYVLEEAADDLKKATPNRKMGKK